MIKSMPCPSTSFVDAEAKQADVSDGIGEAVEMDKYDLADPFM
jgi:hypothetical protein